MRTAVLLVFSLFPVVSLAGPVAGNWSNVPIFDQKPLELRLGTFDNGPDPDLLAVVLWNDGVNRLDAVRIPPPYDGTGVTSTFLDTANNLFALGDICNDDSGNVVVPYIKNNNIEVARHSAGQWSTSTIPGTTTNSFGSADCGVTQNGFFVTGHDGTDSEIEIFRTTNGGAGYTFYGRYGNVAGLATTGALRDQLATTRRGTDAMSLHQQPSGQIRATHFDTSQNPPSFNHTNVVMLAPPPGAFQFVKESAGGGGPGFFFFSYNADGNARTVSLPTANPSMFVTEDLGAVNNNGTQFVFQGGGMVHIEGEQPSNNVLWGDYFIVDKTGGFTTDVNYPNIGVGGPVDGCLKRRGPDDLHSVYAVPRVGSDGTDLQFREEIPIAIFADGFESGDTASWSCDTP